jgi:DNA-binding NarL/FixJ family response regulator
MVKAMLMKVRYFDVVGDAATGELAVANVRLTKPEIVLADIGLPGIDGIETIKQIRQNNPDIRAIMLTAHDSNDDLFHSFRAGAEGYILKTGLSAKRLELAIKTVEDGSVWLDPLIAARVLSAALGSNGQQPVVHSNEPLSGDERVVLEQIVERSADIHEISPHCEYGVCNVDPQFLSKLRRFSSQENNPPHFHSMNLSEVV